ncbi:hypothetical protein [Actinoplanes sp. NPDC051851]|uniref:hypothetical protein n=1 Tax=Actinoplanes sp. NPDC051851 TaxID=3154753 RepID=UPI00341B7EBE
MFNDSRQAIAAGSTVVLSTATGLTINILTDHPSWGIATTVIVLTIGGILVAVMALDRNAEPAPPPSPAPGVHQQSTITIGDHTAQVRGDLRVGMSPGYMILSLAVMAALVAVVVIATRRTPSTGAPPPAETPLSAPIMTRVANRGFDIDCPASIYYFPGTAHALRSALPRSLTPDDAINHSPDFATWVAQAGGWRAVNWVQFTVQNNSANAAILTGLSIDVTNRHPLTSRTRIADISDCGSAMLPRAFTVDFGAHPPRVTAMRGEDEYGTSLPATKFPFKVSATDPEVFDLCIAEGPAEDIEWTATLEYTQDGVGRQAVISDDGRPFHSVPQDDRPDPPAYLLRDGGGLRRVS